MTDQLDALAAAATPGPLELRWPAEQGGSFIAWGKQGTAEAGFTDGWAIPAFAYGVESNIAFIVALVNAYRAGELVPAREQDRDRLRAALDAAEKELEAGGGTLYEVRGGTLRREQDVLREARIEAVLDMHNMLHDGRCDCGDHGDWPMTETFNHHLAAALAADAGKEADRE